MTDLPPIKWGPVLRDMSIPEGTVGHVRFRGTIDLDEDLAWVEREIERAENAGGGPDETADMREQRRLYLERLYKVRDRIEGHS